jgi:hypothetical protein
MTMTQVADVSEQVQKVWSPVSRDEFVEMSVLPALVDRSYEGMINKQNDTVYVSQIELMTGQRKSTGDANYTTFETEKVRTSRVAVVADQVFTTAIELDDLVDLQSQLGSAQSEIRATMLKALEIQVNTFLYSLVSPSTSSPDHSISGVTDFNEAQLAAAKVLADQAKWPMPDRFCIVDPQFHADLTASAGLSSQDYVPDYPKVGGQFVAQRYGFNILMDNSAGLLMAGAASDTGTADRALLFHKSFMALVMGQINWKLSDLHSHKQHGYLLSCHAIGGAKLLINGANKHILTYST